MLVKEKQELASNLNILRSELMSMQAGITHEDQIPNPSDLRAVVDKLNRMIKQIEKNS
tara:strand:- start:957 stop:1130 length:174 start_codon:yes stop_codon:yes gene_type:complete